MSKYSFIDEFKMARPIEKRENIEHGVVEVVAQKGLNGTTIQDIADAAGVSPGLLYRYWKNRNDLAADVYRKHYLELLDELSPLAAQEAGLTERLRILVREFLRYADDKPVILRFLLLSQHDLASKVPPELGVRGFARRLIDEGLGSGHIRSMDADLAVQLLLGIVLQPVVGIMYGHLNPPASSHFDTIFNTLSLALLAPRPVASTS